MDTHALAKLEFGRIRELLSGYAGCSLGRELALRVEPVSSDRQVSLWLQQVREMISVRETRGLPPFGGISDVRPQIRSAIPPAKLEPEDLAVIADTLRGTHAVRRWFDDCGDELGTLLHLGERIGDFASLADRISEVVDVRGQIRDDASAKLARIRTEIEGARSAIDRVMSHLLRSPQTQRVLQYGSATFHDDRMVLPLKAEYRGRIDGIIHRSSDSGATLFVEPAAAVELNNAIVKLRHKETEEINHLLWKLTQAVHLNREALLSTLSTLSVLDLIVAKVRMASHLRMHCADISEQRRLRLRQARHPILLTLDHEDRSADESRPIPLRAPAFDAVVPVDVRLGEDFDLMMVTGPNTGGKTVTLKTVGLLAAMHQSGLPIPAEPGSCLPVFDNIFLDVGDEQSLQQSLSTFSAHLEHVLDTLNRAGPRTLVLIDELGAGTDPEEGAAIGRAVLDELLGIGCLTIVTTHLGVLKGLAHTHPRVENASVEFDVQTLRPTYHLRIGEAGNSNALAIAQRLGMSRRLISSARQHLSDHYRDFSRAIAGTVESRRRAEEARKEAEAKGQLAHEARQLLERQTAELRNQQEAFERWRAQVTTLKRGDKVYVASFSREGTVVRLQLQRQQAVICIGAIEVEVPLGDLQPHADS